MGKEQELLLDSHALKAAISAADAAYEVLPDGPGGTTPSVFHPDVIGAAISTYLATRRSSSDEAEVVTIGYRYRDNPDEPWSAEFWEYISPSKWDELRAKHRFFEPLYASPSGVKAGVTEERVQLSFRVLDEANPDSVTLDTVRRALTAALGVHDEGMGEGWQPFKAGDVARFFPTGCRVDVKIGNGRTLENMHPADVNWGHDSAVTGYRIFYPTPPSLLLKGDAI